MHHIRRSRLHGVAALITAGLATALPASADAAFGDRTLSRGSSGHDVRVLQSWLGAVDRPVTVDGHFGTRTVRAVRGWERGAGLRVDGRVPPAQAARLRRWVDLHPVTPAGGGTPRTSARPSGAAPAQGTISADGRTATAPDGAPQQVRDAIAAANRITDRPYLYGGGHARFSDSGYDCSGAVSYVLHGAGLLDAPLPSGPLGSWGQAGGGRWITVYANAGHAFVTVGGMRFDTSGSGEEGPRWRHEARAGSGYTLRHPAGL